MDEYIQTWLYDMLMAIQEIESFFSNRPKRFADYQKNIETKRAVERNLEIIGEAMSRILKHDESIAITNSRKIVDMRNRIIHGYDSLTDEAVWGVILKHIPVLKVEIEQMLGE
jgi:uncharacterized protein with HEPN domain